MSDDKDFTVQFVTGASTIVRVKAPNHEEAIDKAHAEVFAQPCHQCSNSFDLAGEWEPVCVIDDETNEILWEEPFVD